MTAMNWKTAFAVPVVVLMMAQVASQPARADVAPYDVQGGGATGVLCNQTDMQMQAFLVDVTVNLPDVHEVFSYLLDNPTDRAIDQTVIIPITFETDHSRSFTLKSAQISANGVNIEHVQGKIALEPDLVIDSPSIIGLYANITFAPRSTTNVTLTMSRTFASYTRSFVYIYSAKTARYWNGTIAHGHFRLTYLGELKEMSYSMPNATRKDRVVNSEMYDWDGNAFYNVTVNTGIIYHHSYPYPLVQFFFLPLVIILMLVAVAAGIVLAKMRKKAAMRSFLAQQPPKDYSPQQHPR